MSYIKIIFWTIIVMAVIFTGKAIDSHQRREDFKLCVEEVGQRKGCAEIFREARND